MTFPGYPLTENSKINTTLTHDDHPNHHNTLAVAANDLQSQVTAQNVKIDSIAAIGYARKVAGTEQSPFNGNLQGVTAWTDWPNLDPLTLAHTKATAGSDLLILWLGSAWSQTGGQGEWAVRLDVGADTQISRFWFNTTAEHHTVAGAALLSGVAAGAHVFTLRARVGNPAWSLIADLNDANVLVLLELQ